MSEQHRTSAANRPMPSESVFHLFREVNDHLRATEQKHLQISIGFISVTALALSFLVPNGSTAKDWAASAAFHSWPRALAYFVLSLAGCATMFAQHVYRGWKKDYLLASKKLVYSWPIPDDLRVNWMRTDRSPYAHGDRPFFRLAGDNVLFWFALLITTSVVVLLFVSVTRLFRPAVAIPLVAVGSLLYATVVIYITGGGVRRHRIIDDNWEDFRAEQPR